MGSGPQRCNYVLRGVRGCGTVRGDRGLGRASPGAAGNYAPGLPAHAHSQLWLRAGREWPGDGRTDRGRRWRRAPTCGVEGAGTPGAQTWQAAKEGGLSWCPPCPHLGPRAWEAGQRM